MLHPSFAVPIYPQSLRDSPNGALGSVLPKPLASLRSEGVWGEFLHYQKIYPAQKYSTVLRIPMDIFLT